jgi:hypothetical protein
MLAATLFGSAGRFDIIEFWVYIAIVVAVSVLSLAILDPDLMQERMQPGGRRVVLHFLSLVIVMFLHWAGLLIGNEFYLLERLTRLPIYDFLLDRVLSMYFCEGFIGLSVR